MYVWPKGPGKSETKGERVGHRLRMVGWGRELGLGCPNSDTKQPILSLGHWLDKHLYLASEYNLRHSQEDVYYKELDEQWI